MLAAAADEYGIALTLDPETVWSSVPAALRHEMERFAGSDWLGDFARLRAERDQGDWDRHRLEHTLSEAASLWESGQYAGYVEALSPVRHLLSPAQLKRVEIAEKRAQD
ncbi:MAG TPA: hypothetical protein VMG08_08655 [Allosphingosinicella sp.]|nr:hypothetical protein [Allosphingosinicella sp.]